MQHSFPCPACGAKLTLHDGETPKGGPPEDDPVAQRLWAWRREKAAAEGVSAYVILPNAALLQVAKTRPATLEDLGRVWGIGPGRLEKYGHELLANLEADDLLG